ncbi:MAG: Hydrolase, NUDIX family [Candidatus Falkowbacteria bacterium GW2011_GWF2_43_32]|nr:MAG: Hydrolase, NUDIX family [Candidatus Falkowbacteria bacterium GW2011_GWF2_43_32]
MGVIGFSQKAFVFGLNGKFLTMRRTKTAPSNPLYWDLPGGDVKFGEEPLKSIIREVKEETGLVVNNISLFGVDAHTTLSGDYWVTLAFRGFISRGKLLISWEHDLYKWVSIDEFLKLKIPNKLRKLTRDLKKIETN